MCIYVYMYIYVCMYMYAYACVCVNVYHSAAHYDSTRLLVRANPQDLCIYLWFPVTLP